MGVKLSGLINKKQIDFEYLKGKKIGVDFSNSAYQFLSSIRQSDGTPLMDSKGNVTSHLMGTWNRFTNLMKQGVKLAIIFDGKPPELKANTKKQRNKIKEVAQKKFEDAKEKEDIVNMAKYAKQTSRLTFEMVEESKELIKALGLPIIQAPSEADAQGAFMCEKKDLYAFASSDVDPLLHGCPRTISNLTISQRKKLPSGSYIKINPELSELKTVLKDLGLNQDQLIVMSILVGTDYNYGVKGIGPKTALKLVRQHKNFEELFKEVKVDFNWKKIFAIFKSMPVMKNYQLNWKEIDEDKIMKLLVEKHEFSKERVEKTLNNLRKRDKNQSGLGNWV